MLMSNYSKEQTKKDTQFIKNTDSNEITWIVDELGIDNYNPVEGLIVEIRKKWYFFMTRKIVPSEL